MQLFMLDTNTVSAIIRRKSRIAPQKLAALAIDQVPCISAITEAEMWFGVARTPQAHVLRAAIVSFLAKVRTLPWRSEEAAVYGILRARLNAKGKSLSEMDMLIASHAISANASLVTSDKAFRHVEGLRDLLDWATDV